MLELLTNPNAWAALVTLTVLEIVLGIDNLVFISVLTSRLDAANARSPPVPAGHATIRNAASASITSLLYCLKCWLNPDSFRCASNLRGMRVW